jgi:hypothetical protein
MRSVLTKVLKLSLSSTIKKGKTNGVFPAWRHCSLVQIQPAAWTYCSRDTVADSSAIHYFREGVLDRHSVTSLAEPASPCLSLPNPMNAPEVPLDSMHDWHICRVRQWTDPLLCQTSRRRNMSRAFVWIGNAPDRGGKGLARQCDFGWAVVTLHDGTRCNMAFTSWKSSGSPITGLRCGCKFNISYYVSKVLRFLTEWQRAERNR